MRLGTNETFEFSKTLLKHDYIATDHCFLCQGKLKILLNVKKMLKIVLRVNKMK